MKIAVIGAGAIGSLVAGYLKNKGADVCLVGTAEAVKAIKKDGLVISGCRGDFRLSIEAQERLTQPCDLVILAVKTQDVETALKANLEFTKNAVVITTQNGARSEAIAAGFLAKEKIVSSIVMFGATYLESGKVVHNFEGSWIIADTLPESAKNILQEVFPIVSSKDIIGMKYLKIFVNANNCIPAVLGTSMQEAFSDPAVSRISIIIWKEGLNIIEKSGIKLESLPDFPLERLLKLTSMPEAEAAKVFSGIMSALSKEPLYGSILQSIKRGKPSEIDYINGEFVRLAEENSLFASVNKKLTEMVHQVEKTKRFFSKEELLNEVKNN